MALRKHTVFSPCATHEVMFNSESRRRKAEVMVEGGYASPCDPARKCRMKPGLDLFVERFVQNNPNWYEAQQDRATRFTPNGS